jgi:hypothetical protein
MTTLTNQIDAFVAFQNKTRGLTGEQVSLDYDMLTGSVPTGGNAVTGISGISAGAAPTTFGAGFNAVILGGSHSIQASATGQPDNYALSTDASGNITILDENTSQTQLITGASYILFNGGAANADGSYQSIDLVVGGTNAEIASLYNAALGRQPDLPGLEYYAVRLASGQQTIQQQAVNFIASPEFQSRFTAAALPADNGGPNDQAFVSALYQNVLHRTPVAMETAYYVAALQNGEAGSIVNQTNTVQWTRGQELINFALSPENQADISGWLINTSNGASVDTGYGLPGSQAASSVLNVASGGTINAALINMSTLTSVSDANGGDGSGGVSAVPTTTGFGPSVSGSMIYSGENGITTYLSATIPNAGFYLASNDTVYSAPNGGGIFVFTDFDSPLNSGNVLHLSGIGNIIDSWNTPGNLNSHAIPSPLLVYGAIVGDYVWLSGVGNPDFVATPAAGTTIQGSSFIDPALGTTNPIPPGNWFSNSTIAINVGSVADDTAATMAAAAAKIYTPSSTGTILPPNGMESVVFYGQGANNDTVAYKWCADASHTVSAATMIAGVDLIGVTPTQFHSILQQ